MIYQLHWQNRLKPDETEFIAQSEENITLQQVMSWAREIAERRKEEMPEGFEPMICDENSPYFVKQAVNLLPKGETT